MLIADLLKQEFRKNFRSQTFYRSLAVKLFTGFMAIYFAVLFLMIGFFLGEILEEVHETLDPVQLINGASIYIVLGALIFRFFMQQLQTINLQSYQALPIRRSTLVNFMLLKPIFSISNYLTLLIIIPFAIRTISAWESGFVAFQFVLNCILIIWANTWLASYLKRKFSHNLKALIVILVIVAGFVALEYFKIFSLFDFSMKIFNFLTIKPFGWLVTLIFAAIVYGINLLFFNKNYYPEKFNEKLNKGENKVVGGFSFLEKYGTIGELIRLQIRLIFRHKRTKTLIYLSLFFMLYGLLFYLSDLYADSTTWLVFCGLIITGMASITYGQWVISWESNYFDAILTKNIPSDIYIKANFYILIAFNILSYLISMPYFLIGTKIIYLHTAMFLYNTGINVFLLVFTASFNTKRVDLMTKSSFNYQGTTYKSFLIILPIMFIPILLAGVLNIFTTYNVIMLIFGVLGLLGMLLLPVQMKLSTQHYNKRKYAMAEGFREKE